MKLKGILVIMGILSLAFLPEFVSPQATCGDTLVCSGTYAMYIKAQSGTLGLWIRAQNKNAIQAYSKSKAAILGSSYASYAGRFVSIISPAILAEASEAWATIVGESTGYNFGGYGVYGYTNHQYLYAGVKGYSPESTGVEGESIYGNGVTGRSDEWYAGNFYSDNSYGIWCSTNRSDNKYGLFTPNDIYIGGKIDLIGVVDPVIGERFKFDPEEELEVGDVMIIDDRSQFVTRCADANDTKVLGVIGPEVDVEDGEIMVIAFGNRGAKPKRDGNGELPERTVIKVKVDAKYGAIKRGDLLTTSPTPGHAMKSIPIEVGDIKIHRPGTIMGQALEALETGTGLIEVFVIRM